MIGLLFVSLADTPSVMSVNFAFSCFVNPRALHPKILIIIFVGVCALLPFSVSAQDRCGTVAYTEKLLEQKILLERNDQFENWLKEKSLKFRKGTQERTQTSTYQVPIVVHVVHNGEPLGVGTNLSDAQVLSQISVLNKDFKRLNSDASQTPAEFLPVAGSLDIEFVLAKRTPEGLPTTGIVRVQGSKTEWTVNDNYTLKSQSYWPSENYLNIWVCNITDYLGYAQFPVSSLPGLENSSNNSLTDGVVIFYKAFGSVDDGAFTLDSRYNKGRTTTHEMGHFFGLRHIWGDDNNSCGGSGDYVDDTPDQAGSSTGCPSHPKTTCSVHAMFQNFLDYTNDACMNIFTQGQINRMITVLENSPRRVSLLTSPALLDPLPVANDLGIKEILSPVASECNPVVTPSIEIRNYGNNTITSARLRFRVNGAIVETKDVVLNLAPLASTTVNFLPFNFNSGTSTALFEILLTNTVSDGNAVDNTRSVSVVIAQTINLPFSQIFNSLPSGWRIQNPDQGITWSIKTAPKESPTNQAIYLNFYDYEDHLGEVDIFTTPLFNLSAAPEAVLFFDVAHARFQSSQDRLQVYVLTDCNANVFEGTLVYDKAGSALATTTSSSSAFTPGSAAQWRKETVNLTAFIGQPNVQLAFVGINDWGNNLYIDNVLMQTSPVEDIALNAVSPSILSCKTNPDITINVSNEGTIPIQSFDVNLSVNGGTIVIAVSDINLLSGNNIDITLPSVLLQEGSNTLVVELTNPNGGSDVNLSNNTKTVKPVVNAAEDRIPYRENFDAGFLNQWTIVNPENGMLWTTTATSGGFGTSANFKAFENATIGDESWLISPVLDFSRATQASLQFNTSYALNGTKYERLRVLYSEDCGTTFNNTPIFNKSGTQLTDNERTTAWAPVDAGDWVGEFIALNTLVGKTELRFAFVITNANGNNFYLDNIDFLNSTTPSPYVGTKLYAIYQKNSMNEFYITFNLPERQTVGYQVVDMMGRQLVAGDIVDVVNQTFPVQLADGTSSGIYIVRLKIGQQYYATKIYLSR